MDNLKGLLVFYLGDLEFCADVRDISSTIRVDKLGIDFPVERMEHLKLLINKTEVQIINLHKLFGITLTRFDENTRIFLYEKDDNRFGFFVDNVSELLTIDRKITKYLEFIPPQNSEYLLSIIKFEGRHLYLPDYYSISRNLLIKKTS
jgi:chemotaxis signal transduction protein